MWTCRQDSVLAYFPLFHLPLVLTNHRDHASHNFLSIFLSPYLFTYSLYGRQTLNNSDPIDVTDTRLYCRMRYIQYASLCLIALVLGQTAALPQHAQTYTQQFPQQYQQQAREERKFAEKPNAMKKVAIDDLEDISTNSIQVIHWIETDVSR